MSTPTTSTPKTRVVTRTPMKEACGVGAEVGKKLGRGRGRARARGRVKSK